MDYVYLPTRIPYHCDFCGRRFLTKRVRLEQGLGRFCSPQCNGRSQDTREPRICPQCGIIFLMAQASIRRGRRYCSRNCAHEAKRGDWLTRFWSLVDRSAGLHACWPWVGQIARNGYGIFLLAIQRGVQKHLLAHRVARELTTGSLLLPGFNVNHCCPNYWRHCVQPRHTYVGTTLENCHDMWRDGRAGHRGANGERNGHAKITEADVMMIRSSSLPTRVLVEIHGLSSSSIRNIKRGDTWKHL